MGGKQHGQLLGGVLEDFFRFFGLAHGQQSATQTNQRPGQRSFAAGRTVDAGRRFMIAALFEQLRFGAQAGEGVLALIADLLVTESDGFGEVVFFDRQIDAFGGDLLFHQLVEPGFQRRLVERLGDVGVRLVLQRAHDHGLGVLGGDHQEQGAGFQAFQVDELFQYLLAVLAVAEVVVGEDDVVALVAAHLDGFFAGAAHVHIQRAQLLDDGLDRAPELAEVIDDEKALVRVIGSHCPIDLCFSTDAWAAWNRIAAQV